MRLYDIYFPFITLFVLISCSLHGYSQQETMPDSLIVSSYVEGPHIRQTSSNRVDVFYIQHDSIKNKTKKISRSLRYKNDTLTFKGFAGSDTLTYIIPQKIRPRSGIFEKADKIIVLGDIHGELEALTNILRYNNVIDEKNRWTFGDGHIVFTGDVFDRGNKVTECLWLIFQLEIQAKKAGGRVNYIIGNHEMMALLFDDRYVDKKYKHAARYLKYHYSHFFGKHTVLGNWLRSKNTLMRIGDQLFVHGGISPQFLEKKMKIDDVNMKMRYHLNNYTQLKDTTLVDLFLYSYSPLWYRGYLSRTPSYDRISLAEVIKTLDFYESMVIIFGHTPVARVYPFYSFKLIAMDVPIGDPNFIDQALLIENQKYYRIFAHKEKERLR
ncbi:calcineurin-like phosphoesterase family protein [Marinifilum flexuosum]|uniref:Calcineurin-like phosphoesterase family protein n=2 Tax=Marinifilum flexuosum TaxID=1117708 RepID=A0A419WXE5_9BACT|nr:calcineurin-like phosphoesterase family protein [Marinifilum flexuosum]